MQGRTTEQIIAEIGRMLAADPEYPVENTLLQAEVDPEMISPSIYKDAGDHIMYRSPDLDRWSDILLELWYAQSEKSRWSELEYIIRGGRFEVTYIYPDDIDRSDSMKERRQQALRRYYGDKPVLYPPWDGGGYPQYDL